MDKKAQNLTSILEAMEDGIYIIRQDYTVEFMNKAMIEVFGEGTGKKCYEVINQADEPCFWCRADKVFEDEETLHWELYIPMADKIYDVTDLSLRNTDGTKSKLTIYRDITRSKEREEKLRAKEADYKNLFEHVGCGVFVSSKEGKFLDANEALLDMLGYEDKAEFLSLDIAKDLYLKPEDRRKFKEIIEQEGHVTDYEVDFKHKDGTPVPILLTGHVRYDHKGDILGYEGIMTDQTQKKQMEKEIKKAHDFLDQVIMCSPNAIMATDMKGNVIIWNQGAEETLGYKALDVIGKTNIKEFYPEGMAQKVMKMMESPDYGGLGKLRSYPMTFVKDSGEVVEGNLSTNIIYDEKGDKIASVGIFVDLGQRLEMERTLRRTQEQLLQSEKLAAMGRLTSQIAHEVNNPLYGIMNTLELMKTEISPQNKRRRLLDMSLSETMRLADMLRKMLSFSKPDEEEKKAVDINTILDEILLLYEKQLREHSIKIFSSFAENLGKIYASTSQLRQVFLNMISNARDAMPEGGILTVKTEADGDDAVISVTDTGQGIKEENLDKIFDTFFTTKTDSVKGVGLGLSVCYGFIKDHGGDIKVRSSLGSGTTFTTILPVYKEEGQS